MQIEPGKPRKPLKVGIPPFSRMNFSTAVSTSLVVAPGLAVSTATCIAPAWTAPEAAIWSSWSGVLRLITSSEYMLF
jgi:hypothetical protein